MDRLHIAVDGPSSSGKSTISKLVAEKLGIMYLDTGAMYRMATYYIINNDILPCDYRKYISDLNIKFIGNKALLNDIDVTEEIRKKSLSVHLHKVVSNPDIRDILIIKQIDIAKDKSIIMDGRDIGSNVLKDAEFKFFITASVEVRAKRRYLEYKQKNNKNICYNDVLSEIKKRDFDEYNRELNPLIKTDEHILIDTSDLSINQVVKKIIGIVKC